MCSDLNKTSNYIARQKTAASVTVLVINVRVHSCSTRLNLVISSRYRLEMVYILKECFTKIGPVSCSGEFRYGLGVIITLQLREKNTGWRGDFWSPDSVGPFLKRVKILSTLLTDKVRADAMRKKDANTYITTISDSEAPAHEQQHTPGHLVVDKLPG